MRGAAHDEERLIRRGNVGVEMVEMVPTMGDFGVLHEEKNPIEKKHKNNVVGRRERESRWFNDGGWREMLCGCCCVLLLLITFPFFWAHFFRSQDSNATNDRVASVPVAATVTTVAQQAANSSLNVFFWYVVLIRFFLAWCFS